MTTRNPFSNNPFLLGFGDIERLLERAAKGETEGYPPYNIEEVAANAYRITLAVAGFAPETLSVIVEARVLTVTGTQPDGGREREFLHRGIAARAFRRSFVLADGVEVAGASLTDGLLQIDLTRHDPEPVVRQIAIETR